MVRPPVGQEAPGEGVPRAGEVQAGGRRWDRGHTGKGAFGGQQASERDRTHLPPDQFQLKAVGVLHQVPALGEGLGAGIAKGREAAVAQPEGEEGGAQVVVRLEDEARTRHWCRGVSR
jgi:hypothetical protein